MTVSSDNTAGAIILAGGKSTRMGRDKKMLIIDGETILRRLIRTLSPHFSPIIVSTSDPGSCPVPEVWCVADEAPDRGPLMAIFTCLRQSPCETNFVVACDIPEINVPLARQLVSLAHDYDMVVPSFAAGRNEPLFAVYNRSVIPVMEKQLAADRLRVAHCFSLCNTLILPCADTGWYRNLNTPDDYKEYTDRNPAGRS